MAVGIEIAKSSAEICTALPCNTSLYPLANPGHSILSLTAVQDIAHLDI